MLDISKYEPFRSHKTAKLVALAYPERVAKRRGEGGRHLSVSWKGLKLRADEPLARSEWLAVAEMGGACVK